MFSKYKYIIYAAIFVVIIVVVILSYNHILDFFKSKKSKPDKVELPPQPDDNGDNDDDNDDKFNAENQAKSIHEALDGFTWYFQFSDVLDRMNKYTDREMVKVYNTFNDLYFTESAGSLYNWIQDEIVTPGTKNSVLKDQILNRMQELGLV